MQFPDWFYHQRNGAPIMTVDKKCWNNLVEVELISGNINFPGVSEIQTEIVNKSFDKSYRSYFGPVFLIDEEILKQIIKKFDLIIDKK